MDAPEDLNRTLNRAIRCVNIAAVEVAKLSPDLKDEVLSALVEVVTKLSAMQRDLFVDFPELEYHFEPHRPATDFMYRVQSLAEEAEKEVSSGCIPSAIAKLREALSLEPPAMVYETLEKRRNELLQNV